MLFADSAHSSLKGNREALCRHSGYGEQVYTVRPGANCTFLNVAIHCGGAQNGDTSAHAAFAEEWDLPPISHVDGLPFYRGEGIKPVALSAIVIRGTRVHILISGHRVSSRACTHTLGVKGDSIGKRLTLSWACDACD